MSRRSAIWRGSMGHRIVYSLGNWPMIGPHIDVGNWWHVAVRFDGQNKILQISDM